MDPRTFPTLIEQLRSCNASDDAPEEEKLTSARDESALMLIWELLAITLFDDAKLVSLSRQLRKHCAGLSKVVAVESSRNKRRHIKAAVGYCYARFLEEQNSPSQCVASELEYKIKVLALPVSRNQLRHTIASSEPGPAWSIRVLPVCYPTTSDHTNESSAEEIHWCGALWILAVELKSRLVLIDHVPTSFVRRNPEGLAIPDTVFDQHSYPTFLHRVLSVLHRWGGSVHFPLDGKDEGSAYYKKIERLLKGASPVRPSTAWNQPCDTPSPESTSAVDAPIHNLLGETLQVYWDMPIAFPEQSTPAIRLACKPSIDELNSFQARWNAYGRETAPIAEFRDVILTRERKRIGSGKQLLTDCYNTLLPFLGAAYLTGPEYFSDQKADFWKLLRKRKLNPRIKRMPTGFR